MDFDPLLSYLAQHPDWAMQLAKHITVLVVLAFALDKAMPKLHALAGKTASKSDDKIVAVLVQVLLALHFVLALVRIFLPKVVPDFGSNGDEESKQ